MAGWRRFRRGSWVGAAFAAALVLIPRGASADEPVRIEYRAPAECPAEADFVERVNERSTRARPAGPGELARMFGVTLSLDPNGAVGRVEFVDADGTPITRSVRGASCDEVASGVALVTALAIDARPAAEEITPAAPAAPANPASAPVVAPLPSRRPPAELELRRSRAQLLAGLGGSFVSWLGPDGGVGVDVFVGGALSERGPSLRLSGIHVSSSGSVGGREARFRAWGGRVDVCPLTARSGVLFFQPCGGADFGALQASGVPSAALPKPYQRTSAFFDALLFARFGLVLERRLVLELRGELARPLVTHEFGFERPHEVLFRPPLLGFGAGAGVGVRFP